MEEEEAELVVAAATVESCEIVAVFVDLDRCFYAETYICSLTILAHCSLGHLNSLNSDYYHYSKSY